MRSQTLTMDYITLANFSSIQAPDETSLTNLGTILDENDVKHKLWIEQPENIPTCVVVKPYPKEEIQMYFKKFKLFK